MTKTMLACAVTAVALAAVPVRADYDSHPNLAPGNRCGGLPAGADDDHCQPLYWDIPAVAELGVVADDAPLPGPGLVAGYPHGTTDRPPAMYYAIENGVRVGYERSSGNDGRQLLCADDPSIVNPEHYVPYWKKLGNVDGDDAVEYEVACRRGSRLYFGPWSFGTSPDLEKTWRAVFRVENSARLDQDEADYPGVITPDNRREWYAGLEIYNHIGSHHANMWDPVNACNDPDDPATASSAECQTDAGSYQVRNYDQSGCRSDRWRYPNEGPKSSCAANSRLGNPSQWRAATQFPGRFEVEFPEGRALPILENQLWPIEHHVVARGTYVGQWRDFGRQQGGVVGEIVLQVFTEPFLDESFKRISVLFETVTEAASLFVPPFTVAPNMGVWYAPYDLELALLTTHSHKRTVRSWADVLPANPPRPEDSNQLCGGSGGGQPAEHVFESYQWDDANTCKYYESPSGNLILRKGQGLTFGCLFNNGVRITNDLPEPVGTAIERSPVGEKVLYGWQDPDIYRVKFGCEEIDGAPYAPDDPNPAFVPPGRAPLDASRNCTPPAPDEAREDLPPPLHADHPVARPSECPQFDSRGNRTTYTGRCVPSNIVFSDAEDEMCILVGMYWPLETPLDYDADVDGEKLVRPNRAIYGGFENRDYSSPEKFRKNAEDFRAEVLPMDVEGAVSVGEEPVTVNEKALEEDPEKIGTPGHLPKSPSDIGKCEGCSKLFPPTI